VTQLFFWHLIDAAGPHPDCIRPPHVRWTETWRPGDVIPPGISPPVDDGVPWRRWVHGPEYDGQVASDIWEAVYASLPLETPAIPFPFYGFVETKRLPDGAAWGCLEAVHDGGLSFVMLRDGVLEWEDTPGAGALEYDEGTGTWTRLPAKERWDEEAQDWVPITLAPEMPTQEAFLADLRARQVAARAVEIDCETALVEAGLATWDASGTRVVIRDPDAPDLPVALHHPVRLRRGTIATAYSYSLRLTTPACADLPFVRRVEAVTGLRARASAVTRDSVARSIAVDLATDTHWERLDELLPHTSVVAVERVLRHHILWGIISASNARKVLDGTGCWEPEGRNREVLARMKAAAGEAPDELVSSTAWTAVHAVEDGWVVPGKADRSTFPKVTRLGRARCLFAATEP